MTSPRPSLDDLRREIDEIDTAIHDLLMRRAEIGRLVREVKGDGGLYIRPGREAQILRRLVARHAGPFPARVLVRLWREIVSAFSAMQGPFAIAVSVPQEGPDLSLLARDHFGGDSPIMRFESAFGVMRAVADREATVGVLPLPRDGDGNPWWRALTREGEARPRIVARLPFAPSAQRGEQPEALAVALMPQEESGEDRSLLIVETETPLSRDALKAQVEAVGLSVLETKFWTDDPGHRLALVETDGYLAEDDGRLARLTAAEGATIGHAWVVGGYAVPLSPDSVAPEPVASEDPTPESLTRESGAPAPSEPAEGPQDDAP